jgi:outer membrane protein OmpA-like peptidoglycan-associated protein
LKTHLGHIEGSFVKIREFVNDLDSALGAIDQAFADLQKQLAIKDAALTHANCGERSFSQPIQFEPQQADLSLASVGLLFQARRQFALDRSAERQEWLVIEAYADDVTGPASQALAEQRGEAVRSFLQTELGMPGEALKIVVRRSDTPQAGDVRIFDCLERSPGTVASAPPPQSDLPLIRSASAAELPSEPSPRPTAVRSADRASAQLAMLSEEVDVREDQRGLLLTLPGHLLFKTASFGIEPQARRLLDEIGELLIRAPGREALIIGHSDALGDASYNVGLSERRAQSVRRYLLENFDIAADKLRAEGRGEQAPIASNDTREGRSANRRIEVLLLD